MMSKQFTVHQERINKGEWYAYPCSIKYGDEVSIRNVPRSIAIKVAELLNIQEGTITHLEDELGARENDIKILLKEKIELEKKLECCEYEHFTNELDKLHEKIDKGDYSDFKPLKQEEKDKQIEEDYARLQRRKILERSGNCEPLTLKYNPNTTHTG